MNAEQQTANAEQGATPPGVLSAAGEAELVAHWKREVSIACGAVLLSAAEAAPRLGYQGRRGVERLRALSAARLVPAIEEPGSGRFRYHLPSVLAGVVPAKGAKKREKQKGTA
jgi:hypothetical protein